VTASGPVLFEEAREKLENELRLLRATSVTISSNMNERDYDRYQVKDPGVAIYFMRDGCRLVMACDRYRTPADNLRSLSLAIAAMRQLDRHGGGTMMNRAFTGFVALPASRSCWEILGVCTGADHDEINHAYRRKAKDAHPDSGGSDQAMAELNRARDEAIRTD